ncbi:MAG TPA: hypothetical protein VK306_09510 [Acidimicrobiales bacterium]|nr:hypothetical protein [Acidimicrobiales bacterium]
MAEDEVAIPDEDAPVEDEEEQRRLPRPHRHPKGSLPPGALRVSGGPGSSA